MKNLYVKFAFIYLIILASLGILLRLQPLFNIPINYTNLLHTHSHIAFLGWVYSALFALYINLFSSSDYVHQKKYKIQFILTQLVNLGMLISFPLQGYGFFSILFSTLHILISYWFAYTILKDIESNKNINQFIKHFAKAALLFLLLSSIGPFILPVMIKFFGTGSANYYNTIYYYLHFQYNGWFTFSILAFIFRYFELKGANFYFFSTKKVFNTLFYSTFLTLFLSFLWTKPTFIINIIAGIGSVLQLIFIYFLYKLFITINNKTDYKIKPISKNILYIIITCLLSKILFQLIGTIPYFSNLSYEIRNFIIGYLHLFLIGVITLSIIFICIESDYFNITRSLRVSIYTFIFGFLLSEIWIFLQGISWWLGYGEIPYYSVTLLAFSTFILLSTWAFSFKLK